MIRREFFVARQGKDDLTVHVAEGGAVRVLDNEGELLFVFPVFVVDGMSESQLGSLAAHAAAIWEKGLDRGRALGIAALRRELAQLMGYRLHEERTS